MKKLLFPIILIALFIACDCPECPKQEKPVCEVLGTGYDYVTIGVQAECDMAVLIRDGKPIMVSVSEEKIVAQSGLEPETTYKYVVMVCSERGSATSDTVVATTEAKPLPPTDISSFNFKPDFLFVDFSWNDVDRESRYVITRDGSVVAELPENSTSFTDTGLTENTNYIYALRAENDIGNSKTITQSIKTRGAFIATWDANTEPDLAGYRLYLILGKGEFMIYDGPETYYNFVVDELPCGQLEAYDWSGNVSERCDIVCAEDI